MSLKHVLMIATGGTLACRETGRGLAPSLTGEQLIEFLPELPKICKVVVENPFSIDSTDITTADRVKLAGIIRENYDLYDGFVIAHGTDTLGYTENYDLYDGFVIAHGTDTLGYTSALLYHMLRNLNKPVILTGAQKPIGVPGSDAERNLLDAFRVIRAGYVGVAAVLHGQIIRGNHVVKVDCESMNAFRSDAERNLLDAFRVIRAGYVGVAAVLHGQIIRGNHVVKVDCESMNAFRSINAPLAGTIDREGNVRLDIVPKLGGEPEFVEDIDSDFVLLKLVPDLDPSIITFLSRYKKVIIEGYGSGGIPIRLEKVVQKLIHSGTKVYVTTQCLSGSVNLDKYEVGKRAEAMGAVSLGHRTIEDAIAAIQCGEI